jgi:hypothetical protein
MPTDVQLGSVPLCLQPVYKQPNTGPPIIQNTPAVSTMCTSTYASPYVVSHAPIARGPLCSVPSVADMTYCKRDAHVCTSSQMQATCVGPAWRVEDVHQFQQEDATIRTICGWLKADIGKPDQCLVDQGDADIKTLCALWPTLLLRDGLLYKRWYRPEKGLVLQIVLPRGLRFKIFKQCHTSSKGGGHVGAKRTRALIRSEFFWPRANWDIYRWCKECITCCEKKTGNRRLRRAVMQ